MLSVAMLCPGAPLALADDGIVVEVGRAGDAFDIVVRLSVAAPRQTVWDVLTDFDGMARIVSNLASSRVVSRFGDRVVVEQAGREDTGPLRFEFHSLREVALTPPIEMHSRLIRGSMRRMEGWTRLASTGDGTLIASHGQLDPGHWVPPLIAPHFIERATSRQYAEMRAEMLRRVGIHGR